jgi:hypothetical protein
MKYIILVTITGTETPIVSSTTSTGKEEKKVNLVFKPKLRARTYLIELLLFR